MGTYTGENLSDMLAKQLTDPGNVLWAKTDYLYPAINEAQNTILFLRPDSNSKTVDFTFAQDPTQQIPIGGFRFLDLTRNKVGKPIRRIDRNVINELIPDWTTETTSSEVLFAIFDEGNPLHFSIYPTPSRADMVGELVYAAKPDVMAEDTDVLGLPDSYVAAVIEWALYRCLSSPTAGVNQAAATSHLNNFYQLLGVKNNTDVSIAKKTGE